MSASARRELPAFMEVRDFLEWPGDGVGGAYELVDGVLRAMAPGSTRHAGIQANLTYLLSRHLNDTGSGCRVLTEAGVIPRLRSNVNVRIPDVLVTCAPDEAHQAVAPDPVLLIEILSPGNESGTRANVWAYATIPSVREIVLIHSTKMGAEIWRRGDDGQWPEKSKEIAADDTLVLESIGFSANVRDAYRRTYLLDGNAS